MHEQRQVDGVERAPLDAGLGGLPADRVDPRVGVLHVEDRVLVRLRGDQVEVDGLAGVERLEQEGEPGHVGADLVDEVVEQHEVAGPLRQPHLLAAPHERHELAEDDLELVGLVAERLHAGLQARDVAVVVGAPDVDEQLEAAGELVAVVGDVGEQVGGLAVGLHEDPVLVVAEVGGAQPDGAVLLEDDPAVAEVLRAWRRWRPTRRGCSR